MDSGRRQAPRYPFIAEAVVTEISSDTKLIAKTGPEYRRMLPRHAESHTARYAGSRPHLPRRRHIYGARQRRIYPPQYGHGRHIHKHRAGPANDPTKMDRKPEPPRVAHALACAPSNIFRNTKGSWHSRCSPGLWG